MLGAHGGMMGTNSDSSEGLLPEITNCRAQNVGLDGFAECLDVGPKACPYALPFGYAFLCQHPRLATILSNTKSNKMPEGHGV